MAAAAAVKAGAALLPLQQQWHQQGHVIWQSSGAHASAYIHSALFGLTLCSGKHGVMASSWHTMASQHLYLFSKGSGALAKLVKLCP